MRCSGRRYLVCAVKDEEIKSYPCAMNPEMPKWVAVLALGALLFPPFTQWQLTRQFDPQAGIYVPGPRAQVAAGWAFIGALGRDREIRWGVLALELGAIAAAGWMARKPSAAQSKPAPPAGS